MFKIVRRKVFISYYHDDDQSYKDVFDSYPFNSYFINKSVRLNDINPENSTPYIKRLINENHIDDSTVLIVLIGGNSYKRKYIDWEISAALNAKIGGYSGLFGLVLPYRFDYYRNELDESTIPPRLLDNFDSGFAKIYRWSYELSVIYQFVENAIYTKDKFPFLINNSRVQFKKNH